MSARRDRRQLVLNVDPPAGSFDVVRQLALSVADAERRRHRRRLFHPRIGMDGPGHRSGDISRLLGRRQERYIRIDGFLIRNFFSFFPSFF